MNYRTHFTQLIDDIAGAATARETWDVYMSAAAHAHISHGVAYAGSSGGDTHVHDATAHTRPPGWSLQDSVQRPKLIDPLMLYAMVHRGPFSAAQALASGDFTQRPHQPANDTGYEPDQTFVIPDFTYSKTVFIYLYGDARAASNLKLLHLAGLAVNARLREMTTDSQVARPAALSLRELECLQWASSGKTDWEIGEILHLSEKTVNEYVERAKHKLGVPTRIQAIVEGIRSGAIRI